MFACCGINAPLQNSFGLLGGIKHRAWRVRLLPQLIQAGTNLFVPLTDWRRVFVRSSLIHNVSSPHIVCLLYYTPRRFNSFAHRIQTDKPSSRCPGCRPERFNVGCAQSPLSLFEWISSLPSNERLDMPNAGGILANKG